MKQTICDLCGKPITGNRKPEDGQLVRVHVELDGSGRWRDYHRGCARRLTIVTVWNEPGWKPL